MYIIHLCIGGKTIRNCHDLKHLLGNMYQKDPLRFFYEQPKALSLSLDVGGILLQSTFI